jgi:hypothetical protein
MEKMSEPRVCPICGHEVPRGQRVYCSLACQYAAQRARQKDPATRAKRLEQNRASRERSRAKVKAGARWDKPLNGPRLCPGGQWNHGKCGHKAAYESRWCAKCQRARREYYGLGGGTDDPAQGFGGGEVEHEVAI